MVTGLGGLVPILQSGAGGDVTARCEPGALGASENGPSCRAVTTSQLFRHLVLINLEDMGTAAVTGTH